MSELSCGHTDLANRPGGVSVLNARPPNAFNPSASDHASPTKGVRGLIRRLRQIRWMAAAWALLASGLIVVPARARGPQSTSDEWPPVPPEELALKDDPANPGASAILLYREISTDDVKAVGTNYYRVKILTESGKKYADIEIPYLNKAIEIRNIRA